MNENIIKLLSSGLAIAIVTSLFNFLTSQRADSLKYITEERRKWREELRVIALELECADFCNIKFILTKIKVRINAYGNTPGSSLKEDKHIWEEINLISKSVIDNNLENFNFHKEKLGFYISMLLKYDWERAKYEVSGQKNVKFGFVILILGIYYCIFYNYEMNKPITYDGLSSLILFTTVFPFLFPAVFSYLKKELKKYNLLKITKFKKFIYIFSNVIIQITLSLVWLCMFFDIKKQYDIHKTPFSSIIIFITIFIIELYISMNSFTNPYFKKYDDKLKDYIEKNSKKI